MGAGLAACSCGFHKWFFGPYIYIYKPLLPSWCPWQREGLRLGIVPVSRFVTGFVGPYMIYQAWNTYFLFQPLEGETSRATDIGALKVRG